MLFFTHTSVMYYTYNSSFFGGGWNDWVQGRQFITEKRIPNGMTNLFLEDSCKRESMSETVQVVQVVDAKYLTTSPRVLEIFSRFRSSTWPVHERGRVSREGRLRQIRTTMSWGPEAAKNFALSRNKYARNRSCGLMALVCG